MPQPSPRAWLLLSQLPPIHDTQPRPFPPSPLAVSGLELLRRAQRAQCTRHHHAQPPAGRLRFLHAVRRQQHAAPGAHLLVNHTPQRAPSACIEHRGGPRHMRKHGACMPGWRIGRGRARMQSGARGRPWLWPWVRSPPGSIPELGSSRSSTGRSATSAAATPSRRWLPPLRLPAALREARRRAYARVACTLRLLSLRALVGLEHHSASQTHWPKLHTGSPA